MATTSVAKSTIIENIWKNFFDRVKDQVKTASITGSVTVTVQNYVSSFPDQLIDSKSDYPILVVNDPKVPSSTLTATKSRVDGTIEVEIYTTQAESASKFLSQIMNAISGYKKEFGGVGIRQVSVVDTNQDSATRGKIKLHNRSVVFSFTFFSTKTVGF